MHYFESHMCTRLAVRISSSAAASPPPSPSSPTAALPLSISFVTHRRSASSSSSLHNHSRPHHCHHYTFILILSLWFVHTDTTDHTTRESKWARLSARVVVGSLRGLRTAAFTSGTATLAKQSGCMCPSHFQSVCPLHLKKRAKAFKIANCYNG